MHGPAQNYNNQRAIPRESSLLPITSPEWNSQYEGSIFISGPILGLRTMEQSIGKMQISCYYTCFFFNSLCLLFVLCGQELVGCLASSYQHKSGSSFSLFWFQKLIHIHLINPLIKPLWEKLVIHSDNSKDHASYSSQMNLIWCHSTLSHCPMQFFIFTWAFFFTL